MARTISEGSWVHVKLPGRKRFTTQVRQVRPDGTYDLIDPKTGHVRTVRPHLTKPANAPKAVRV